MNDGINTQISAFVDGELSDNEAQLLLRRLSQDAALRQQAAEYLALGRAIRGERSLPGAGDLRARIAASLDDDSVVVDDVVEEQRSNRFARPLVGFAIAATVAVAALVGLQQISVPTTGEQVADVDPNPGVTEPQPDVTEPDFYLQRHQEANSDFNTRRVEAAGEYVEIDAPDTESEDPADGEVPPDEASPADPAVPTP